MTDDVQEPTVNVASTVGSIVESWTENEVLEAFMAMTEQGRVGLATDFMTDDEGNTIGTMMLVRVGERMIASAPIYLDWPLQPCPMPEDAPVEILN